MDWRDLRMGRMGMGRCEVRRVMVWGMMWLVGVVLALGLGGCGPVEVGAWNTVEATQRLEALGSSPGGWPCGHGEVFGCPAESWKGVEAGEDVWAVSEGARMVESPVATPKWTADETLAPGWLGGAEATMVPEGVEVGETVEPLRATGTAMALALRRDGATGTAAVGRDRMTETAVWKGAAATATAEVELRRSEMTMPLATWILPMFGVCFGTVLMGIMIFMAGAVVYRMQGEGRREHAEAAMVEAEAETLRLSAVRTGNLAGSGKAREVVINNWMARANPQSDEEKLVAKMLRDAFYFWLEEYADWVDAFEEKQIPTDSKIGWSGSEWQAAVNLLKGARDEEGNMIQLVSTSNQGTMMKVGIGHVRDGLGQGVILIG